MILENAKLVSDRMDGEGADLATWTQVGGRCML